MDEKTKELIAIGASVAGHCQPCLTYHVNEAKKLGLSHGEIEAAVAVGKMVEKGAMAAMNKFADDLLKKEETPQKLSVYDPAMCCSSGVCGPQIDPALVEFAGALKVVAERGIVVQRFNLSQQPKAFAEHPQVKQFLNEQGSKALPLIFINDALALSGRYPTAKELFDMLKIEESALPERDSLFKNLRLKATPPRKTDVSCCGGSDEGGCC